MELLSWDKNGCVMDRRDFLKKTSAAAAATASGAAIASSSSARAQAAPGPLSTPAVGNRTTTLRTVVPDPTALTGPTDNARRLFRDIEVATQGRYRFDMTSSTPSSRGFSEIVSGNADAVFASPHEDMHHHKAYAFFGGLPQGLGLDAAGLQSWMVMGGNGLLDELSGGFGIKSLVVGHLGAKPALWSRVEINSLEDLKSMRISVPGLSHDILVALGVAFPNGYHWSPDNAAAQLIAGRVDAADTGGAFSALQAGIADKAAFGHDTMINSHGATLALHLSASVWNGMSDADRLIVSSLASASYQSSLAENLAHETMARRIAGSAHGVSFKPLPTDISTVVAGLAGALLAHTAAIDRLSERINARYMAFRRMRNDAETPSGNPDPIV